MGNPEASAEFVCQMEEVLDVYQRPFDQKRPIVCLDEARRQLVSETHLGFTDKNGVDHVDYEYKREGVVEIFMVAQPLAGQRQVVVTQSHNSIEWAKVVGRIVEEWYTDADRITLVQDNLSAHRKAALYEVFEPKRARTILQKIDFVYTPKHGSWLNVAEIELSILTRQGLTHRVASQAEFDQQVQAWVSQRNDKLAKVDWQFTAEDARIKLKRLYPSTIES
ncbi:IS630 family transposase [Spirosoma telluris]|uniref:IS630 family transposase n=1 Tax=Spirosoma telluris TaxID=2183553 RepID=UPI0038CD78FC